jgi:hypothetical protein
MQNWLGSWADFAFDKQRSNVKSCSRHPRPSAPNAALPAHDRSTDADRDSVEDSDSADDG